jgi:hypothetical protein
VPGAEHVVTASVAGLVDAIDTETGDLVGDPLRPDAIELSARGSRRTDGEWPR